MTAPSTTTSRDLLIGVGVASLAVGLAIGLASSPEPDWTEAMHPDLVSALLTGELDEATEARTLRFLAATSNDPALRYWASSEARSLIASPAAPSVDAESPAEPVSEAEPEAVTEPSFTMEPGFSMESDLAGERSAENWSFVEPPESTIEPWEPSVSAVFEETDAHWFMAPSEVPFDFEAMVMTEAETDPSFLEAPPQPEPAEIAQDAADAQAPVIAMVAAPEMAPEPDEAPEPAVAPEPEPEVVAEAPPPPPPPTATMSARELDLWVLDGDADEVRERVAERLDGLKACYAEALAEDHTLSGAIELEWNVFRGRVKELAAVSDSLGHEGASSCMTEQIARWSFDAETHGVMTWLVSFQPEVVASK